MSILDTLGITEEELKKATGSTVTEAFELMPSGVYPAKIKEVILYKNKFGGEMLKINVAVKYNDQDRIVSFRDDIGKNLKQTEEEKAAGKPGKTNEGFVNRLKSLSVATGVDMANVSVGAETKINAFGAECVGNFLLGFNDKPVKALVRHSQNSNKKEGDSYRDTNDIEGITHDGHEDISKFEEKVAKKEGGIFTYKGYVKDENKANESKEEIKEAAGKINF